jgi:hypothetical protein
MPPTPPHRFAEGGEKITAAMVQSTSDHDQAHIGVAETALKG